jgi:hypothetical protein
VQERYLDRREAADYLTSQRGLRISRNTLQKMATTGGGPPYRIFGIRAVYLATELDAWADTKLSDARHSTSELKSTIEDTPVKDRISGAVQ